jgi:hypothetical protein
MAELREVYTKDLVVGQVYMDTDLGKEHSMTTYLRVISLSEEKNEVVFEHVKGNMYPVSPIVFPYIENEIWYQEYGE